MFYQTDPNAPRDFQKYGCLFSVLRFSPEYLFGMQVSLQDAIRDWELCRSYGLISGDLNRDGDYDDVGEDEILDYNGIFELLNLPLYYPNQTSLNMPMVKDSKGIPRVAPLYYGLDSAKYYVAEHWFWRAGHFVLGDGRGVRPVKYDPIKNGSNSVRFGACHDLRVFKIQEV